MLRMRRSYSDKLTVRRIESCELLVFWELTVATVGVLCKAYLRTDLLDVQVVPKPLEECVTNARLTLGPEILAILL
jgi:hypothetical protein